MKTMKCLDLERALPSPDSDLVEQVLKDPYNFDFLTVTRRAPSEVLLRAFRDVDELSLRRQQNGNRRSGPARQGTSFELNASAVLVNDRGTQPQTNPGSL